MPDPTGPFWYRSYRQLLEDMHDWSSRLPHFAAVCGVPRSGLVPAALLALRRNIQLVTLDDLLAGRRPWLEKHIGTGRDIAAQDGPVLILDDTACTGARMRWLREQLTSLDARYAAYAVNTEGEAEVDYFCHDIGGSHNLFEWNVFHHGHNAVILTDLDGVLCEDWTQPHEEGDLEAAYLDHLENARCLVRPTHAPLLGIVTGRLEKHRGRTEAWLRRHGIPYKWLAMCPCASPAERGARNDGIGHKVRVYREWGGLFVESDAHQADEIFRATGKPALSWCDQRYLTGAVEVRPAAADVYSHAGDVGDLIAALPILAARGGGDLRLVRHDCTGSRMTQERYDSLRPLLELQPYIRSVQWRREYEGERLDRGVRQQYRNGLNLADMQCEAFGIAHWPREKPWLAVPGVVRAAKVVFARSPRYRSASFDWRRVWEAYHLDAVFLGTPEEHADFVQGIGPVAYYHTLDYLELARVVAGAELVVANQTSIFWLAEALKVPAILEVCTSCQNCHFARWGLTYATNAHHELPPVSELSARWSYNLARRAGGLTLLNDDRLAVLAAAARQTERSPGAAMAELGVYRGGSALVLASACPGRKLHLFDTFAGIPEDDAAAGGAHRKGDFAAALQDVQAHLAGHNAQYHVGTFPGSAAALPDDYRFGLVHLDGDTYQTTREALSYFWPRLVPGGVLVLDDVDWPSCPGVNQALAEARLLEAVERTAPQQGLLRKP